MMHDFEQLDYYQLLGVPRTASEKEIKQAYRKQIAQYHPDRYGMAAPDDRDYASQRTQRINEAYRVLSSFETRVAYNRGQLPHASRQFGSASRAAPVPGEKPPPRRPISPRDHQAELYEQAAAHLQAGRYTQAAATLRELQQINPFYRDSATLLARAEAGMRGKGTRPPEERFRRDFPPGTQRNRSRRKWLVLGGIGGVLMAGVFAAAVLGLPHIQANGEITLRPTQVANTSPASVPTETLLPTEDPFNDTLPVEPPTREVPQEPTEEPPAEPTEEVPQEPTEEPPAEPTEEVPQEPTEEPPAEPTAAPAQEPTRAAAVSNPEQGNLLFADNFSPGGPGGLGWADQQGLGWTVGYGEGFYRITAQPGPGNIWSYRTAFEAGENFSLGSDVQVLSGAGGLVMRFVDRQNYLAYMIDPANGSYVLEQHTPAGMQVVADGRSEAIKRGSEAINRLVAHLQGNQVRLFVNEQPLADVTLDGIVPTNVYGLVAVARNQTAAEVLFDNIEIRTLE